MFRLYIHNGLNYVSSADIPPAMSLGIDPSEKDVMARKPR